MGVEIFRLLPSVSSGWVLWPVFEDAVVRFNQRYLSETTPAQTSQMVNVMRQRFVNDPASSGYWLAMDGANAVGHAAGWLSLDWNAPYVFIYQAAMGEAGHTTEWLKQLDEWVVEMNDLLTPRGSAPIAYVEFSTFNDPTAMKRLLEMGGRKNIRYRSTMRFDV
jgi:hypothetical protein